MRQTADLSRLRLERVGADMIGYIPVAGTWGFHDDWYRDDAGPFATMMLSHGFTAIRDEMGLPFRWSTDLDGVRVWARHSQWQACADALRYFARYVPYPHRNILAHSHAGQGVCIAAAAGFKIRTLVTVGTPVRADVPSLEASKNIGLWQHVYDDTFDLMGSLGAWFDRSLSPDRSFAHVPTVVRHPLHGIDHSKVLREEHYIPLWQSEGWLDAIRLFDWVKESA